jgi:redox-sensitive bicupin YhaK (pirin superfamily)
MDMTEQGNGILKIIPLGFPWATADPFLFCVYHADAYPKGNGSFGPDSSLSGRKLGNDFELKDGWRMYHGKAVPGFPVHPHRGFETVTVVRKGLVDHSDSLGGAGRYGHGDVQWMTAGKGMQHAEMFPLIDQDQPNHLELFQIWLNLPSRNKFVDPYYAMLWEEQIPLITSPDRNGKETQITLIAGFLENHRAPDPAPHSWAAQPENEVAIWYLEMESEASWSIPHASKDTNRTLYFFEGDQVLINDTSIQANHGILLDSQASVQLTNGNKKSRFLLLQGKPIGEPVANYGPFVMNTQEEIQEAFRDYQESHFGGWPWPRHDMVHPVEKGRFALHPNGKEKYPSDSL